METNALLVGYNLATGKHETANDLRVKQFCSFVLQIWRRRRPLVKCAMPGCMEIRVRAIRDWQAESPQVAKTARTL